MCVSLSRVALHPPTNIDGTVTNKQLSQTTQLEVHYGQLSSELETASRLTDLAIAHATRRVAALYGNEGQLVSQVLLRSPVRVGWMGWCIVDLWNECVDRRQDGTTTLQTTTTTHTNTTPTDRPTDHTYPPHTNQQNTTNPQGGLYAAASLSAMRRRRMQGAAAGEDDNTPVTDEDIFNVRFSLGLGEGGGFGGGWWWSLFGMAPSVRPSVRAVARPLSSPLPSNPFFPHNAPPVFL